MGALTSVDAHTCAWADGNESARSSYAIAWAQGRLAFANEALQLVARHVAHGQCHGLSYGLVVAEEEWRRLAPPDSALATLRSFAGRPLENHPQHPSSSG